MKTFKDFGIPLAEAAFTGEKIKISKVLNREIVVCHFEIKDSKYTGHCLYLQIELEGIKKLVFTASSVLMDSIKKVPKDGFPFSTTIIEENERFQFT